MVTAVGSIRFESVETLSEPPCPQEELLFRRLYHEPDALKVYGTRIHLSSENDPIYNRTVADESQRQVLDVELVCPVSGFRIKDGTVIPVHKIMVVYCRNGSLMAFCPNHVVRSFISDRTTVKAIMDGATLISMTPKKAKKETLNG